MKMTQSVFIALLALLMLLGLSELLWLWLSWPVRSALAVSL